MYFNTCLTAEQELDKLADLTVEALKAALDKTSKEGNIKHGIRFVGDNELLCTTKEQSEGIADFFEDLGFSSVTTGYYDPKIDEENGETDEYTGFFYVNWE